MRELHLFAGAGGGILGGILLGHTCVCAVEIKPYCRKVLLQRQRDGILPKFPIWDDVRTFDGKPWRGIVDVVCGGFPCQDISAAGKGAGIEGEQSGLWSEMARVIREVQPKFVFVENSPMLTLRGIGRVLGDLAAMGLDARWGVLGAADAIWLGGVPCLDHARYRIWILACSYRDQSRLEEQRRTFTNGAKHGAAKCAGETLAHAPRIQQGRFQQWAERQRTRPRGQSFTEHHWWQSEPSVGRVANGVADRVERLAALGDGQVPAVVRLAWEILMP